MYHTHPEITTAFLRQLMAKELWILRKAMRQSNVSMCDPWVNGIRIGFETALVRIEGNIRNGVKIS